MMQNIIMFSILAVIATVIVCFVVSTFLPGIERKYVHARIQQRIGPPVTSPGIMAPIKFAFKKNVDVVSPLPKLYKALPIICFMAVLCILVALTPQAFYVPALASLIAVVGLLKVEEICYVLMGALSKSVMSVRMPFPDLAKGAAHTNTTRSFMEDISARRSLRMITYGSFPLYLAVFAPITYCGSIFLKDIVQYQQALFSVLFIGIPPNIFSWGILVNIVVALIFVFMMGIFSAFTLVFTNRQLLPTIVGTSLLGVLAIVIGVL